MSESREQHLPAYDIAGRLDNYLTQTTTIILTYQLTIKTQIIMATTFRKNECYDVAKEAEELRQDISAQMENRWEKRNIINNGESYPIAFFLTHDDMRWGGSGKRVYSRTAANIVVRELKNAGYYVWYSDTSYYVEDWWITTRPERPHHWFVRV